ncbi:MAG TPA: TA system VapC family ribonuclease toxin [Dongiaceae bacterium]|nr:TA system VapC family ribonuclease toxin [Dongiaceae bacterium]
MPASGVIEFADANVWLALAFSDHAHHGKAKAWFDAHLDGSCAFCRVTQMALLRHLTNSKIMGRFVQNQRDAWRTYDRLAQDPRTVFLSEPLGLEAVFRRLANSGSPAHALWTDAFLAALAIEGHARLVTFDQGYRRFAALDLLLLR